VRERVVVPTISIRIPCIVKKHQIAGMDDRPSVNPTLRQHMVVDEPDPIRFPTVIGSFVKVDPMGQIDRAGDTCAVIGD
jgi:hypothetical protein